MKIQDFKDLQVCYPKEQVNLKRYEIPSNKNEFYTTKYSEFDLSVPMVQFEGLHLELGVFRGRSLRYLADTWKDIHWYGFDTFEGIGEVWDLGEKKIDMRSFKIPVLPHMPENVTLIQGLFQETLASFIKEKDEPIAYLNLDADVYSATKYALDTLNDNIRIGTIIRFDELSDWRILKYETNDVALRYSPLTKYTNWKEGEWKALIEWMEEKDRRIQPLWRSWCQSAGAMVVK